jgi:hypothetical protein
MRGESIRCTHTKITWKSAGKSHLVVMHEREDLLLFFAPSCFCDVPFALFCSLPPHPSISSLSNGSRRRRGQAVVVSQRKNEGNIRIRRRRRSNLCC